MDFDETLKTLVRIALEEDFFQRGDVTSDALIDETATARVAIVSREQGVISGVDAVNATLESIGDITCEWVRSDANIVNPGDDIAHLSGNLRNILKAERTSLNFLQHLSGVATYTSRFVEAIASVGSSTIVRDTRKTLPGYRALEKKAVVDGGGQNHRMGLYDAFLVKDNHLMGRDLEIVANRCREFDPSLPLEVEVDSLSQLEVVLGFDVDVVLLDNFSVDDVHEALELVANKSSDVEVEISGGVNLDNVAEYAKTDVKYIAVGALTHSAPALDIGFDAR